MLRYQTLVLLFFLCLVQDLKAQTNVRDDFINSLRDSYRGLETLTSNFKQVKTLSIMTEDLHSSGSFYYEKPNRMKWNQLAPDLYYFIINGDDIVKFDGKKRQHIAASSPQAMIFKEFILGTVDGSIFSDSRFESSFSKREGVVDVSLIPKESSLKRRISTITLVFNDDTLFLESLVIEEKGGDLTSISFKDQKRNVSLSQNTFE